jgi:hypothetical protein
MTDGFEVFVHDVIDAITTAPCGTAYVTRPSVTGCVLTRGPREEEKGCLEGEEGEGVLAAADAASVACVAAGAAGALFAPAVIP